MGFDLRHKRAVFHRWQRMPHKVKPLSGDEHECATCHTVYMGNFCPRCGQSASIGRYSFKAAILLFFDVWGLGNRGMYHTLRDLMLRPGYMVRDYLRGMQMAYFPPFKMMFLLSALSLIIAHGFNILGQVTAEDNEEDKKAQQTIQVDNSIDAPEANELEKKTMRLVDASVDFLDNKVSDYPNLGVLLYLAFIGASAYVMLRRCPNLPDMRFSEMMITMVYTYNMYTIYTCVIGFLCLPARGTLQMLALLQAVFLLHQFTGYSWLSLVWRLLAATLLAIFVLLTLVLLLVFSALVVAWATQ